MKCPRCQNAFNATPDPTGIVICPGCGSRLRTRPAAAAPAAPAEAPGPAAAGPRPAPAPKPAASVPGPSLLKTSPVAVPAPAPAPAPLRGPTPDPAATLEAVLQEIRGLREGQEEILELLRRPAAPAARGWVDESFSAVGEERAAAAAAAPAVRSRRRKTVLLIDDDPQALAAAVEALGRAEVPVRTATEGNASLAMIAEEKPDVIVMELGLTGSMAGKDVINMIKATMEWVDVPIVLYTRMPIESQREARQIHGADEYVLKGPGSVDAMVARVIAIFRKG
jgi:CheY-like chemotaxis protein